MPDLEFEGMGGKMQPLLDGFSNGTTHQVAHQLSDHAPVSATLNP